MGPGEGVSSFPYFSHRIFAPRTPTLRLGLRSTLCPALCLLAGAVVGPDRWSLSLSRRWLFRPVVVLGGTCSDDVVWRIILCVRILLCMRLIVAEKPSVGRDIAGALGRHRREKGALVGDGWTVTWALGHLAELAPPDAYGEEYKKWRLESLPILPGRFKVRVNNKTREQFGVVKGLMKDPVRDGGRQRLRCGEGGRAHLRLPVWSLGLQEAGTAALDLLPHPRGDPGRFRRPARGQYDEAPRRRGPQPGGGGLDRGHERHPRLLGPLRGPGKRPLRGPRPDPDPKLLVEREREIQDFEPEKFWTVHARFSRKAVHTMASGSRTSRTVCPSRRPRTG